MKWLDEFKEFAVKGNVVDLAVGIIIGGAFGKIVTSLVNDIVMPIVGLALGGTDFTKFKIVLKEAQMDPADATKMLVPESAIRYGQFVSTTLDFLIVAFSVFLMVKAMNTLRRRAEEWARQFGEPVPSQPSQDAAAAAAKANP